MPSASPSASPFASSSGAPVMVAAHLNANLVTQLLAQPSETDHSTEVARLAQDKIWSSIPPKTYTPNGKINFLHLKENGVLVITVFKPNTKPHHIYAKIRPEEVVAVLEKLQWMTSWDIVEEKGWDNINGDGDKDGNTFHSHRKVILWDNGFEAHWIVSHQNVGNQVLIGDKLLLARDGAIQEEEDVEEALED